MSSIRDIFNDNFQIEFTPTDDEDDEFPAQELLTLQRTRSFECCYCKRRCADIIPFSLFGCPRVCFFCKNDILSKSEKMRTILYQKYKIVCSILPDIHNSILEIGLHPNRVQQTQHYDHNWF